MKVWKKSRVRYIDPTTGKRVPRGTEGAKKQTEKSGKFYGSVRLADGSYRQVLLTYDRTSSKTLLRRLQRDEDEAKASGITRSSKARTMPLTVHVEAYRGHLTAKNNTPLHIDKTISRINRIIESTGAARIEDLNSDRIQSTLKAWRDNGAPKDARGRRSRSFGIESSNNFVRSLRGFSRWLHSSGAAPNDALIGLRCLNSRPDRRHPRRALTRDELKRLIQATRESTTVSYGLDPESRAVLYTLGTYVGLRASELASLTRGSIDLAARIVRVSAASSKHRRDDVVPLHPSLVPALKPWLAGKEPGEHLWPGPWASDRRGASMLRGDLELAGIPYRTDAGFCDFHSLRHIYITSIIRAGVHITTAMDLARHSDISTTMRYVHGCDDDMRSGLAKLPGLG